MPLPAAPEAPRGRILGARSRRDAELWVRFSDEYGSKNLSTPERFEPYRAWCEERGFVEFTFEDAIRHRRNTHWRDYVAELRKSARDAAMSRLKASAGEVVDDYLWARERSRVADDYKETRLASSDHLDRIGATEKPPEQIVQVATVLLRSSAEFKDQPLKELPPVEAETVEEANG